MKKIKILAQICALLLALPILAQDSFEPNIEWTKKQHMARKQDLLSGYSYLEGNEKEFFFIYRTIGQNTFGGNAHVYLIKMNMETGAPEYLRVQHKTDDYERSPQHVFIENDKIYAISSYQNKKDEKHYLFIETINKETFEFNGDVQKIGEIGYGEGIKGSKLENVMLTSSPNKDLRLLSYSIVKGDKITNFGLLVLNKNMTEMWHKESPFPSVAEKDIWLSNYTLDNDGNVYVAQNRYDKKDKMWELYITYFPANNVTDPVIKEVQLEDNMHSISDKIITNNVGDVICTGFYTNPDRYSPLGMYSYIYSSGLKDLKMKDTEPFSEEFITMGMNEKDINKMLKNKDKGKDFDEGFTYSFDTKLDRKDGGYTMTFEKYKLQIQTRGQGPNKHTVYYHNYNDIVTATYNNDGSFRWVQKIPKRQRLAQLHRLYGSYKAWLDKDDNVKFIYNENMTKDTMNDKVQPIIVTLDHEGKIKYTEIFKDDKNIKKHLLPCLLKSLKVGNTYLDV